MCVFFPKGLNLNNSVQTWENCTSLVLKMDDLDEANGTERFNKRGYDSSGVESWCYVWKWS